MKPAPYLIDPEGRRTTSVPFALPNRDAVDMLLVTRPTDPLDCVPLRAVDATRELVLVRRPGPGASLNEASAYTVAGHRVQGRALICTRPKGAEQIGRYLSADPQVGPAPLTDDEAAAMVEWSAPVAGELQARTLDVQMLDAFAKDMCERAAAAAYDGVLRLEGIDQGGRPAVAFNVAADKWRDFRRAALDLYDRRWSVVSDLLVRAAPVVRGSAEETPAIAEFVAFSPKAGGHQVEILGPDGKPLFGSFHAEPIRGAKLMRRTQRAVAMPGLPFYLGDSQVPMLGGWSLVA